MAPASELRLPSPSLTPCFATDSPLPAESPDQNTLMRSAKAVISERLAQLGNTTSSMTANAPRAYTTTSLKRWSVLNKELPSVSQIRAIHVYDFDNTLFLSPLPNPQLWNGSTIGFLQAYESFANGGWWHDPTILAATGSGTEIEEPQGWQGCWNEQIIRLVRLSMEQKDALTVLLTGRGEANFGEPIKRMVASQKLDFDLVGLKPEVGPNGQRFSSTMNFKQNFLQDLIFTYKQAEEIRVYEDRVKHVSGFRDFFEDVNRKLQNEPDAPRTPMTAEVIQVSEDTRYLDPATEVAEVQRMINSHNLALRNSSGPKNRICIKRTVFYTGYLLSAQDSNKMVESLLVPLLPPGMSEANNLKYMANSILIAPRPAPKSILEKIGGMGKKSGQTNGYEGYVQAQGQSHGYHPYQNNRNNYDEGSRKGSGRGRGRGNGRGRGARGGRGRGRGGSNPYYKSLDDQTGYEPGNESKGGNAGGGYSMDY
ncbi:uncharacterized protein N7477_006737 [Penicillium maclennaniae]|uniref:uncharacterized protein n=1 Tax=Penicillium maclennaniae TaxID=1343394 RepID=UPI00254031A5|nr:uncharacterized protein N7477_006737 [Penicillium maclennaniae]KAJ5668167.1 hypothetical protein N7477_006737 [Penicillium maclennaniae]